MTKLKSAAPAQGTPAPPPTGPVPVNTTRLKVLRTHPGYAHHCGEEVDLEPEQAAALVSGGFAQVLTTDVTDAETR